MWLARARCLKMRRKEAERAAGGGPTGGRSGGQVQSAGWLTGGGRTGRRAGGLQMLSISLSCSLSACVCFQRRLAIANSNFAPGRLVQ